MLAVHSLNYLMVILQNHSHTRTHARTPTHHHTHTVMKHYPDKEDNITSIVASSSRMYSGMFYNVDNSNFFTLYLYLGNISSRIDHFEGRFRTLRLSTLKYLEETNSSITDIKHSLLALPLAIRNEHEKLLVVKYSLVEKAESVGGVFAIITSYLSYLDYSLLEHIIKEFGSESLKSQMKVYARDMKEFRMNTTISSIIPYLPRRSDLQEGFAALKIKLNFDPDTMTLEDLNEQRKQLASEFLLSDFALLMTQFRGGSLKVEWLIPKAVVSFLRQFVKDKPVSAIEKLQISQLSIDDEVLYPLLSSEEVRVLYATTKHFYSATITLLTLLYKSCQCYYIHLSLSVSTMHRYFKQTVLLLPSLQQSCLTQYNRCDKVKWLDFLSLLLLRKIKYLG